jgi:hypothetical protein
VHCLFAYQFVSPELMRFLCNCYDSGEPIWLKIKTWMHPSAMRKYGSAATLKNACTILPIYQWNHNDIRMSCLQRTAAIVLHYACTHIQKQFMQCCKTSSKRDMLNAEALQYSVITNYFQ